MMSSKKSTNVEETTFQSRLALILGTDEPNEIKQLLNISYQGAKNYVVEGRLPEPKVLITIAEKTGVSLNWLLTGEGEMYWDAEQVAQATAVLQKLPNLSVDAAEILERKSIVDEAMVLLSSNLDKASTSVEKARIKLDLEKALLFIQLKLKELELEDFDRNNQMIVYEKTQKHKD